MRVIQIRNIFRNDCTMDLECRYCSHIEEDKYAYNDVNYIHNVVPSRHCPSCGLNEAGIQKPKEEITTNN